MVSAGLHLSDALAPVQISNAFILYAHPWWRCWQEVLLFPGRMDTGVGLHIRAPAPRAILPPILTSLPLLRSFVVWVAAHGDGIKRDGSPPCPRCPKMPDLGWHLTLTTVFKVVSARLTPLLFPLPILRPECSCPGQVQKMSAEVSGNLPPRLVLPGVVARLNSFSQWVEAGGEAQRGRPEKRSAAEARDNKIASPGVLASVRFAARDQARSWEQK